MVYSLAQRTHARRQPTEAEQSLHLPTNILYIGLSRTRALVPRIRFARLPPRPSIIPPEVMPGMTELLVRGQPPHHSLPQSEAQRRGELRMHALAFHTLLEDRQPNPPTDHMPASYT